MIRKLAIALTLVAVGFYSALSFGEELGAGFKTVGNAAVESGDYKPLTLWTTLTVGASYYTNPQRAQAASLAYAFEGPEFSDFPKSRSVWELANSGKLSFGIVTDKSPAISVVDFPTLRLKFHIRDADDLTGVLARSDVKVISSDKVLLGEHSKATVIKTDTKQK